jgi:hypothetical protein
MDEGRVAFTLGRHTNGYMNSFYADTPSGFFMVPGRFKRNYPPRGLHTA